MTRKLLSRISNKIYFAASIICLAFPISGYAQNDLVAIQTSPTNGQTLKSGTAFSVGLSIKNNAGPALKGTETFILTCYVDYGSKVETLACATFTGPFTPIAAGATVGPFNVSCTQSFTGTGSAKLCQSVSIQGNTDPNPADNVSCSTVTIQGGGTTTCNPPTNIKVTNLIATGATASWTAATGATGYQATVNTSATAPASGQDITGTTIPITGLAKNTKYYLHIRSKCGTTFSAWQSSTTFTTPGQTAINTVDNNEFSISIYPNPATDRIVFSTDHKMEGKLQICDINGKVLISQPINSSKTTVSISEIPNGLYLYRLFDNSNVILNTGKFDILH